MAPGEGGGKKATYATAAAGGQWSVVEKKKNSPKRPPTKIWSPEQRCFELPRDLTLPSRIGSNGTNEELAGRAARVQAAINKMLHGEGASARIRDLFRTRSGKYRGSTQPSSSAEQLLGHRVKRHGRRGQDCLVVDQSPLDTSCPLLGQMIRGHGVAPGGARGGKREGANPSSVRWLSGQGSPQRQDHGFVGGLRGVGRVGLPIDPKWRFAAPGPPMRGRGLRRGKAGRGVWPLQRLGGSHRASVRTGQR